VLLAKKMDSEVATAGGALAKAEGRGVPAGRCGLYGCQAAAHYRDAAPKLAERRLRASLRLFGFLWFLLWIANAGMAQTTTSNSAPAQASAPLQQRLAEAKAELARVLTLQGAGTNLLPGATASEATEYRLMADSVVRVYQQHLEELGRLEAAKQRLKDFEPTAKAWTGFAEPPPYSILLVDDLRDSVQTLSAEIAAAESSRELLARFSAEAQTVARNSDERLRWLAEQLETTKDTEKAARLNWQRSLEQTKSRLASAHAALDETRRRRVEADLAVYRLRLTLAKRQLALAAQHPRFSQADLDQVIGSLDTDRQTLESELPSAEADHERRQQALAEARANLQKALAAVNDSGADAAERAATIRKLQDLVQLSTAQAETSSQRMVVLRQMLEIVIQERGLWQLRFQDFDSHDVARLREGYQRLSHLADLARAARPHFLQQVELAANLITEQSNRIQNRATPAAELAQSQDLLEQYRQREELAQRALRSLEKLERLTLRWKQSLDASRQALPLTGRLRDLFTEFSSFATKFWHFELFAAEDTIIVDGQQITGRRSVTVGKIAMAILILVIGYWVSILLARWLERIAVKRLKVEPNQAILIRRWARVVLIVGLVVFSLVSVKIPLTVFAFLGGALAIGLGFGTQNLLKNFISGIIILFERPFRVGDVLDVGGNRGTVTSIGVRSSVVQYYDGTETLIPNSALLENNLTNWTYSNHIVRFSLAVGVAYGSDTRRVAQLLADVADRHGLVCTDPKPLVLFADFGASTLNFELRYWVDVMKNNAAQIGSDLRHMIAGGFAENGIVIAFPQQDVHLDASRPLQVEMVQPQAQPCADGPVLKAELDNSNAGGTDSVKQPLG
jgi:potassium-dependent mechanosensitive channel